MGEDDNYIRKTKGKGEMGAGGSGIIESGGGGGGIFQCNLVPGQLMKTPEIASVHTSNKDSAAWVHIEIDATQLQVLPDKADQQVPPIP